MFRYLRLILNFHCFITFTTNVEAFVHAVVAVLNLALAVDVPYSHYCKLNSIRMMVLRFKWGTCYCIPLKCKTVKHFSEIIAVYLHCEVTVIVLSCIWSPRIAFSILFFCKLLETFYPLQFAVMWITTFLIISYNKWNWTLLDIFVC